jgi:hypothetical protein
MDNHGSGMAGLRLLRSDSCADSMKKWDVVGDMRAEIGAFPNISQIAEYLHWSRDKVRTLVAGLDYVETGRSKQYFVVDVVNRLMEVKGVN